MRVVYTSKISGSINLLIKRILMASRVAKITYTKISCFICILNYEQIMIIDIRYEYISYALARKILFVVHAQGIELL